MQDIININLEIHPISIRIHDSFINTHYDDHLILLQKWKG